MLIKIKKNGVLIFKKFRFRCVLGKLGIKKNKKEGDKTTPRGIFSLGKLYYRSDRIKKINTHLKCKVIKKNMGWCNDPNDRKYNKEFDLNSKKKGEKLFRKDHKYDAFIPINYNTFKNFFQYTLRIKEIDTSIHFVITTLSTMIHHQM